MSRRQLCMDYYVDRTFKPLPIRCDLYLKGRFKSRSRNQIQKLFKDRRVLMNSRPVSASKLIRGGEDVRVLMNPEDDYIAPGEMELDVIYEDDDIIAVNKGVDVVMHPSGSVLSGTMLNALHYYFEEKGSSIRPGILQRLDKDTTGLVVFAKTSEAHQVIQRQVEKHQLEKVYIALVKGTPWPFEGTIDHPIGMGEHPLVKKMMIDGPGAKRAVTHYKTLGNFSWGSLMGVRIETGRQHQIRVHMAHIGHPILGDALYGGDDSLERQALHSYYLRFSHPNGEKKSELFADIPEDISNFFKIEDLKNLDADSVDIHCKPRPWNPRIWLDNSRRF